MPGDPTVQFVQYPGIPVSGLSQPSPLHTVSFICVSTCTCFPTCTCLHLLRKIFILFDYLLIDDGWMDGLIVINLLGAHPMSAYKTKPCFHTINHPTVIVCGPDSHSYTLLALYTCLPILTHSNVSSHCHVCSVVKTSSLFLFSSLLL